jgi:hypothetical protein
VPGHAFTWTAPSAFSMATVTLTLTIVKNLTTFYALTLELPVVLSFPSDPPSTLTAIPIDNSTVTLTWFAPANIGSFPVTSYVVQRVNSTSSTTIRTIFPTDGSVTYSCNIGMLAPLSNYTFSVLASSYAGLSDPATIFVVTLPTPAVPDPPQIAGSGLGGVAVDSTSVQLSWNIPLNVGTGTLLNYLVQLWNVSLARFVSVADAVPLTTTTLVVPGLTQGTNYSFAVFAQSSIGLSRAAVIVVATVTTTPTPPTLFVTSSSVTGFVSLNFAPGNLYGLTLVAHTIEYQVVADAIWLSLYTGPSTTSPIVLPLLPSNASVALRGRTRTAAPLPSPWSPTVLVNAPLLCPGQCSGAAGVCVTTGVCVCSSLFTGLDCSILRSAPDTPFDLLPKLQAVVQFRLSVTVAQASATSYQSNLLARIAASLTISASRLKVTAVQAGSVLVNLTVQPDLLVSQLAFAPVALVSSLIQMTATPGSTLRTTLPDLDPTFIPLTTIYYPCLDGSFRLVCPVNLCPNVCFGRGICDSTYRCLCNPGSFGIDCSLQSDLTLAPPNTAGNTAFSFSGFLDSNSVPPSLYLRLSAILFADQSQDGSGDLGNPKGFGAGTWLSVGLGMRRVSCARFIVTFVRRVDSVVHFASGVANAMIDAHFHHLSPPSPSPHAIAPTVYGTRCVFACICDPIGPPVFAGTGTDGHNTGAGGTGSALIVLRPSQQSLAAFNSYVRDVLDNAQPNGEAKKILNWTVTECVWRGGGVLVVFLQLSLRLRMCCHGVGFVCVCVCVCVCVRVWCVCVCMCVCARRLCACVCVGVCCVRQSMRCFPRGVRLIP